MEYYMAYFRVKKMQSLIQKELSELIRKEIKDPRIVPLTTTISYVKVSKDLRYVTVYISVLGDEEKKRETMKGLESARGFLQNKIGKMLKIRFTPELRFKLDDSLLKGDNIIYKLKEIVHNEDDKEEDKK
jgi:ribosome-binding factor A